MGEVVQGMSLDKRAEFMWSRVNADANMAVPWYMILSFLYYVHDISLVPDEDYDKLCKLLLEQYDGLNHRHKGLVDKDALAAGTGYHLAESDYPSICKASAILLAKRDKHLVPDKRRPGWLVKPS